MAQLLFSMVLTLLLQTIVHTCQQVDQPKRAAGITKSLCKAATIACVAIGLSQIEEAHLQSSVTHDHYDCHVQQRCSHQLFEGPTVG